MTVTVSDSGILFADGSLQPTALTTGTQTIAGAKTFSSNVTLGAGVQGALVLGNSVATTSGTTVSVATGLPSWVKRITLNFVGVSTSGTSGIDIRLGYGATTWVASGYAGASTQLAAASTSTSRSTTGCFLKINTGTAVVHGQVVIELQTGTTWTLFGSVGDSVNDQQYLSAYSLALGNTLTGVQLATSNGTDTFDAGSVNIMYEG